jgi:hypothetical protein
MTKRNLRVLILTCWAVLFICCILKVIGLDIFTVGTTNPNTIAFCIFIDNNFVLKVICACISSLILNSLSVLAILQQKFYTKCQMLIFIPLILVMSLITWSYPIISSILGFIIYLIPMLYLKRKWYRSIIGILAIYAFQILSIIIKNVGGWELYTVSFLPAMLLQIDSTIMLVLFYLYSLRKEVY